MRILLSWLFIFVLTSTPAAAEDVHFENNLDEKIILGLNLDMTQEDIGKKYSVTSNKDEECQYILDEFPFIPKEWYDITIKRHRDGTTSSIERKVYKYDYKTRGGFGYCVWLKDKKTVSSITANFKAPQGTEAREEILAWYTKRYGPYTKDDGDDNYYRTYIWEKDGFSFEITKGIYHPSYKVSLIKKTFD